MADGGQAEPVRVFASWSGDVSKSAATLLHDWLPRVIQSLSVWMSAEDIDKGDRWSNSVADQLAASRFGIVCLTPRNLHSPWLHFEAGAVAKSVVGAREDGRVTPLMLGVTPSQMQPPLSLFQATKPEKDDMRRLMRSLNAVTTRPLAESVLDDTFDMWWPKLDPKLAKLVELAAAETTAEPPPAAEAPDEQILERLRDHDRALLRIEEAVTRPSSPLITEAWPSRVVPDVASVLDGIAPNAWEIVGMHNRGTSPSETVIAVHGPVPLPSRKLLEDTFAPRYTFVYDPKPQHVDPDEAHT